MKAKVAFEVENCTKCPFHEVHQLASGRSRDYGVYYYSPIEDYDTGIYCSLTQAPDPDDRVQDTTDGHILKRLIVADDYPEKWADVPAWCPFIIKGYAELFDRIRHSDRWQSHMVANADNPNNYPYLGFDRGVNHVKNATKQALTFLDNLVKCSFESFCYGDYHYPSTERDKWLTTIAIALRDFGVYNNLSSGAIDLVKTYFLNDESGISIKDINTITNAILRQDYIGIMQDFSKIRKESKAKPLMKTDIVIRTALCLSDVLDVGETRVIEHGLGHLQYPNLAENIKKVSKVEFRFAYDKKVDKIGKSNPNFKNTAELRYTADEGFDIQAILKDWPELITTPRNVAKGILGLSFKLLINNKHVNIRQIVG